MVAVGWRSGIIYNVTNESKLIGAIRQHLAQSRASYCLGQHANHWHLAYYECSGLQKSMG